MNVMLILATALTMSADFTVPNGKIRPELHSSSFGPQICSCPQEYIDDIRSFGMKASRTHDWALINPGERVCDNHMIFPLEHLDPKDPKSYYFKATDALLKRTREELGHDVFFRLGTSIEHARSPVRFNTLIPKDFGLVAENFAATVRHYNRGWADGFNWGIRYWEIWNEPDGCDNMWCFPEGDEPWEPKTPEDKARQALRTNLFVEFFVTSLKRLKGEFGDSIKVGGPALCFMNERYFRALLDGCRKSGVAPDFISWHYYGENAEDLQRAIRKGRELCTEYGFPDCELIINEYHYFAYSRYSWDDLRSPKPEAIGKAWTGAASHNGIDSCAFLVSTVSLFHDTDLGQAFFYGCRNTGSWGYMDALKRKYKVYHALKLLGRFMRRHSERYAAKGIDPEGAPVGTVLAGKSADGRKLGLLVADYRIPADEIVIDVKGVPEGARVEATLLDNDHDPQPVDFSFSAGKLVLRKNDAGSAVCLIEIDGP